MEENNITASEALGLVALARKTWLTVTMTPFMNYSDEFVLSSTDFIVHSQLSTQAKYKQAKGKKNCLKKEGRN